MGNKTIIAVIVAVCVLAVAIVLGASILANANSNNGGNNDDDDDQDIIIPKPHLEYMGTTYTQNALTGDVTCNVKVTNTGDAIGSKTIHCKVTDGSQSYSATKYVTLAPAETSTFEVVINVPFGVGVNNDNLDIWLS